MKLRTAIVSLLALGLLAWFLRGTNFADVWFQVQRVRAELLVASFVLICLTFVARTIRWRYLLSPLGETKFRTVFRATVIGFGALALLPVRVGDVIRPYLLARQERLSVSSVFATVVMERVLDLVAVLALLAVYVWGFAGGSDLPPRLLGPIKASATIAAAGAATLLAIMWVLATHPERIGGLAAAVARFLPGKLSDRVGHLASTFSSGFAAARSIRQLVLALVWSFVLWLGIAAQAWTVTIAFGIPMSFPGTFLLQSMLVIGVAVPTPGGVGSFHEAYRLGVTTFFGASRDQAVAAALVTHLISFIPPVLGGILFMAQDGLSFGRLEDLASSARDKEGPTANEVPILRSSGRSGRRLAREQGRRGHQARRECLDCGRRFTSYERIDEIPYMVIKKDGTRERFERQKLIAGLLKACEKRPVSIAAIEAVADKVEATLQERPEKEMATEEVGALVMDELKRLDKVAYVRFASVYRHFRDISEFMTELKDLLNAKE